MKNFIIIAAFFILNLKCASYNVFSNLSANSYYGNEFDYYAWKAKIFKGFYVQDSVEGEEKRILQVSNILSKRENKKLFFYIPRQPEEDKYIEDYEELFNKKYLECDSILPSSKLIDIVKNRKKISKIKVREEDTREKLRDSVVAVIIPRISYPYKERILRSLGKYKNYPIYLLDDYKKNRCFILFPVLDTNERISYYIGKLSDVKLDYIIRSKKKLIISYVLIPFALTFDIVTSPVQIYLLVNFPNKFMSKVKGF